MMDLVISRVNELGKDQPHSMVFSDRHGCLIGDVELPGASDKTREEPPFIPAYNDDIEIPGVDLDGPDGNQDPPIVETVNDPNTDVAEPMLPNPNKHIEDVIPAAAVPAPNGTPVALPVANPGPEATGLR